MNSYLHLQKIYFFILIFGFFCSGAFYASAKVTLEDKPAVLHAGLPFQIPIIINTADNINALEGEIIVPSGIKISGISDGNSIISFWPLKPELENNRVKFSGIIPGGVSGSNLLLFTLRGTAEKAGNFSLRAENLTALANDGRGSPLSVFFAEKIFSVLPFDPNIKIPKIEKDTVPPAPFFAQIGRDESVYQGKPFIVFETNDKESGLSHYESAYSFWPFKRDEKKLSWKKTKSPFILPSGFWPKYVYVRAADFEGNTQTTVLSPQKEDFKYLALFLLVMIVVTPIWRYLRARSFFL